MKDFQLSSGGQSYSIPNTKFQILRDHSEEAVLNMRVRFLLIFTLPPIWEEFYLGDPQPLKRGEITQKKLPWNRCEGKIATKGVKWVLPFPTAVPDDWVFPHCGTNLGFTISHPGNSGRLRFCHAVCHLWQIYYTKYTNTQKYTNIQIQTASHTNNYKCTHSLYCCPVLFQTLN